MFCFVFLIDAPFQVQEVPFHSNLLRILSAMNAGFCQKPFCTYWDVHIVSLFSLLIGLINLTDLQIFKSTLNSWNKSHLIIMDQLIKLCGNLLHQFSWEILICSFLFWNILTYLWYQTNTGLTEWAGKESLLFRFLVTYNWYYFFLKCLIEFPAENMGALRVSVCLR